MKAVSTSSVRNYVPLCDRDLPSEDQTVFELKTLSAKEDAVLDNLIGSVQDGGMNLRIGDQNLAALHIGLVGVSNFQDETGKDVKIVRDRNTQIYGFVNPIKDEVLSLIPKEIRLELARAIINGKELDEEETKN
jgi:hypothetical protein